MLFKDLTLKSCFCLFKHNIFIRIWYVLSIFFSNVRLKNVPQKIMCFSTSRLISFQWLKFNKLPASVKTITLFKKDHFNTLGIKCPTLLMKSQWSQGFLECLNSGSSEERSWARVMLKCFQWLCSKIYSLYKGLLWEIEAPIF